MMKLKFDDATDISAYINSARWFSMAPACGCMGGPAVRWLVGSGHVGGIL